MKQFPEIPEGFNREEWIKELRESHANILVHGANEQETTETYVLSNLEDSEPVKPYVILLLDKEEGAPIYIYIYRRKALLIHLSKASGLGIGPRQLFQEVNLDKMSLPKDDGLKEFLDYNDYEFNQDDLNPIVRQAKPYQYETADEFFDRFLSFTTILSHEKGWGEYSYVPAVE